jgi:hypothetical protein
LIGTGIDGLLRDLADARERRGELHDDRLRGRRPRTADHLRQCGGIGTELHPPLLHIGAAHIELVPLEAGRGIEPRDDLAEFVRLLPDDIHEDARPPDVAGDPGEILGPHRIDAGIREPHRVDHPAREIGDARRRGPHPRLEAHRLGDEAAE